MDNGHFVTWWNKLPDEVKTVLLQDLGPGANRNKEALVPLGWRELEIRSNEACVMLNKYLDKTNTVQRRRDDNEGGKQARNPKQPRNGGRNGGRGRGKGRG